ncbi:UbiX family flavin prenyltransferase [Trichlorobacter ammonificans]|uniref:Flavin prenyltransferase UbiX n=1 Tax=Trichlorobacter ammonificans TaxID=2916410 RepID=A0ABN8HIK9_9BACT|nr:flavin prenyltransferase UbiX [Trichlorobacter ammonificans]CAH2032640.1 Flavin prenyltransferase UbiX [Trichlorobacter ammonificans]
MRILLAITGASGAIYGLRLAEELLKSGVTLTMTASPSGIGVCRFETGVELAGEPGEIARLLTTRWQTSPERLNFRDSADLWAPEASGSAAPDLMIVAPCSMGTLGRIAAGLSGSLIERAADVMLKEARPLILLPRETPLSAIHLENMLRLSQAGARIVPAMPAFYHQPASLDALVDFVVGKVLDQAGVPHTLFKRWGDTA